ncbi:MAG: PfkB family carbohydrate kinase [Phycisphaerae bacterium]
MSKIVTLPELLHRVAEARAAGKTIVHCHGCFDIVHPGHIRYLDFARRQGDVLVVSLTGDSQVSKDLQRPYIPQELRAENLAALEAVDLVYVNDRPTATDLLRQLKPDIYVKGREYEQNNDPGFLAERQVVSTYGGRVMFSSGDVIFSSTRLIEALSRDPALDIDRLTTVCRRHEIDRNSTEALLNSFPSLRVLIVGDVLLDHYVLCDATDLADEAPMMSLTQLEERVYIGGTGIIAQHVAGLGAKPYLLSACAADEATRHIREMLTRIGAQAHLVPTQPHIPRKTRYLVDTNKVMRVEDGRYHPLDSLAEEKAAQWVKSIIDRVDAIIISDFGYGTITGGLISRIREIAKPKAPIITADASSPRGRLLDFKDVDLLCPAERTLRACMHDFERGLSFAAWDILQETNATQLLVTLGRKGLVVFSRQSQDNNRPEWRGRLRSEYLPLLADHLVDSLGCDSALQAAATLALAAGGSLMQAAYLGSATVALEYASLGNEPVNANMLRRWLSMRLELSRSTRRRPGQAVRFPASPPDDNLAVRPDSHGTRTEPDPIATQT